jgi:hypothetical protein
MIALLCFCLTLFASRFKSKSRLEAENTALRHQLIVLQRRVRGRVPSVLNAIRIIRPETLVRWHRAGFRQYWLGNPARSAADRSVASVSISEGWGPVAPRSPTP